MKDGLVDIVVVLDRSGSMSSVRDDTIGGFNTFLAKQKEDGVGEVIFSLVQFDNEYTPVHRAIAIKNVPDLNRETFVPRNGTALLDAIGRTINETGTRLAAMDEADRPEKVMFVILTDGQENQSVEFTREKVFDMIKHQTEVYSWEFVFLGANQDAIQAGASLGVSLGKSMSYASNAVGTLNAFDSVSRITSNLRSKNYTETDFLESERQTQYAAGATASAVVPPITQPVVINAYDPNVTQCCKLNKLQGAGSSR